MSKTQIKKNILLTISAISLLFMLVCSLGITAQASEISVIEENTVTTETITRSAIIDWRYKAVDGKLYRRLYNYTEQCWIGEWELCP